MIIVKYLVSRKQWSAYHHSETSQWNVIISPAAWNWTWAASFPLDYLASYYFTYISVLKYHRRRGLPIFLLSSQLSDNIYIYISYVILACVLHVFQISYYLNTSLYVYFARTAMAGSLSTARWCLLISSRKPSIPTKDIFTFASAYRPHHFVSFQIPSTSLSFCQYTI